MACEVTLRALRQDLEGGGRGEVRKPGSRRPSWSGQGRSLLQLLQCPRPQACCSFWPSELPLSLAPPAAPLVCPGRCTQWGGVLGSRKMCGGE